MAVEPVAFLGQVFKVPNVLVLVAVRRAALHVLVAVRHGEDFACLVVHWEPATFLEVLPRGVLVEHVLLILELLPWSWCRLSEVFSRGVHRLSLDLLAWRVVQRNLQHQLVIVQRHDS